LYFKAWCNHKRVFGVQKFMWIQAADKGLHLVLLNYSKQPWVFASDYISREWFSISWKNKAMIS